MGGCGSPALISCCLLFACLCLTKQFSLYVGALKVDSEVDCEIDINDMLDYDPVTQTSARCERMKREKQKAKDQCQTNLEDATRKLESCLTASDHKPCDCPPPIECQDEVQPTPCHDAEDMFFRRLVRHFANVIQEKAPESGPVEAQIEVHLTSHEWKKLQSFADGKDEYRRADIHDVMVGMTINIFYFNQTSVMEWLGEQINLRSPAVILLTVSVTVLCIVFGVGMYSDLYWNRRFIACLLTSMFVISLIWNWIYLYQEETIKRYRNAQKYEKIPANCMPHKMTWVQALHEWFTSMTSIRTDECFEYHRIYQVDPLFDIPPTRALSVTVSSLFVDNFKYFGRAVSEFHAEIFKDLPFWAALPALVSCYIFGFIALYVYIAAPRRVLRERPQQVVRRRDQPALGAAQERNLPIAEHEEYGDLDGDDGEGNRIENIRPPTLPAARKGKKEPPRKQGSAQKTPPGSQHLPQGAVRGHTDDHPWGIRRDGQVDSSQDQVLFPGVKRGERLVQEERDYEVGPSGLGPAVRPKISPLRSGQTFQNPADKNDADTSSSDSIEADEPTPRPRDFVSNRPSRQKTPVKRATSIGDCQSGNLVSHPASERSDGESLMSSMNESSLKEPEASVALPRDTHGGHLASAPDEETTDSSNLPTGFTTPSSIGSPDDISVISQSPENTNSASYDFITTSSFGLHGEQTHNPEADHGAEFGEDEDFEDDFEVLKIEK
ncbi:chloride channel CLIC-like protein 1 [Lytechinus pictus]|uniref:chloride channel CLIC-like protein 1 n=1 Tax=Lytechinus pictus TaxID=7653 RepID=UPI0030BA26F5